jgi:hypothetical protein
MDRREDVHAAPWHTVTRLPVGGVGLPLRLFFTPSAGLRVLVAATVKIAQPTNLLPKRSNARRLGSVEVVHDEIAGGAPRLRVRTATPRAGYPAPIRVSRSVFGKQYRCSCAHDVGSSQRMPDSHR